VNQPEQAAGRSPRRCKPSSTSPARRPAGVRPICRPVISASER